MPYLTCPDCHISVFRGPLDLRPASCPRCGVATATEQRYRAAADSPARYSSPRPAALLDAQPVVARRTGRWASPGR